MAIGSMHMYMYASDHAFLPTRTYPVCIEPIVFNLPAIAEVRSCVSLSTEALQEAPIPLSLVHVRAIVCTFCSSETHIFNWYNLTYSIGSHNIIVKLSASTVSIICAFLPAKFLVLFKLPIL